MTTAQEPAVSSEASFSEAIGSTKQALHLLGTHGHINVYQVSEHEVKGILD